MKKARAGVGGGRYNHRSAWHSHVLRRLVGRRSDNPNDAVNGTYGGQGKAVAVDPRRLCCLSLRNSKSVVLCSPSQAAGWASHSFLLRWIVPPAGAKERSPDTVPVGAFLRKSCHGGRLGRSGCWVPCSAMGTLRTAVRHPRRLPSKKTARGDKAKPSV
jgi:hypothetical protein